MKQQDKELLLKDLSARLPYGVKIKHITQRADACQAEISFTERLNVYTLKIMMEFKKEDFPFFLNKPYLLPLSSMTKEQRYELHDLIHNLNVLAINGEIGDWIVSSSEIDWYNKNHFDYRGLIKKSLAIDATGLNVY